MAHDPVADDADAAVLDWETGLPPIAKSSNGLASAKVDNSKRLSDVRLGSLADIGACAHCVRHIRQSASCR